MAKRLSRPAVRQIVTEIGHATFGPRLAQLEQQYDCTTCVHRNCRACDLHAHRVIVAHLAKRSAEPRDEDTIH